MNFTGLSRKSAHSDADGHWFRRRDYARSCGGDISGDARPPGTGAAYYPRETAIAEKFEAMVKLGIANSRMKDFHDLRSLAALFAVEGKTLSEALRRTFERRGTALPASSAPPTVFTAKFFKRSEERAVERVCE